MALGLWKNWSDFGMGEEDKIAHSMEEAREEKQWMEGRLGWEPGSGHNGMNGMQGDFWRRRVYLRRICTRLSDEPPCISRMRRVLDIVWRSVLA